MYICRKCEGLFDAGELHGGVCEDCLEAERQQEERQEQDRQMRKQCIMEQADGQMALIC